MNSSGENGDKERIRNRRVSFDYAPSVIDIQMNVGDISADSI